MRFRLHYNACSPTQDAVNFESRQGWKNLVAKTKCPSPYNLVKKALRKKGVSKRHALVIQRGANKKESWWNDFFTLFGVWSCSRICEAKDLFSVFCSSLGFGFTFLLPDFFLDRLRTPSIVGHRTDRGYPRPW